jgi:hypothetical protein
MRPYSIGCRHLRRLEGRIFTEPQLDESFDDVNITGSVLTRPRTIYLSGGIVLLPRPPPAARMSVVVPPNARKRLHRRRVQALIVRRTGLVARPTRVTARTPGARHLKQASASRASRIGTNLTSYEFPAVRHPWLKLTCAAQC